METPNPQRLPFHEWMIVCLIILLMFFLSFVTYMKSDESLPQLVKNKDLNFDKMRVFIQGAVKKPGEYTLKKNSLLAELLELAEPLPEADLRLLKRNKKIKDGQHLYVPLKALITIYIEGAVEQPGPLKIWKGTRFNELKSKINLQETADPKFFNKKRYLKDQEIIKVPNLP